MSSRRILVSVCLISAAAEVDAVAQTLGRPPAPAARWHDRSYGTWTDLADGWDYFPPAGIAERQKILAWAGGIRHEAAILERSLVARNRDRSLTAEIEAVRVVRFEAGALAQELLHGAHFADWGQRLTALGAALDQADLRDSVNPLVVRWREAGEENFARILVNAGPRPRTPRRDQRETPGKRAGAKAARDDQFAHDGQEAGEISRSPSAP